MPSINYIVRGEKRSSVPIYIRYITGGKVDVKIKTGYLVNPVMWSNRTQALRQRILSRKDKSLINGLAQLREYIETESNLRPGPRSKAWLQGLINRFHNIREGAENSLNGYVQDFINRIDKGEIKNSGTANYTKGTIARFRGFQGVFNRYQGVYTDEQREDCLKDKKQLRPFIPIDFEQIDRDFYRDFVQYLSDEGYKVNTMARFIKELKHIMHRALIEKKHVNRDYEEFAGKTEDSHSIYLATEEIDKIWNYKCDNKRIEIARDCFIVLCETALRISDYQKINIGVRGKFIDIYQTKTAGRVIIPLTARMELILKKYSGRLPYIHENYVNKYIKTVAFACGIKDTITWIAQDKGMKHEVSAPKWSLVTCHTGRRSAATNMYLAGIKTIDIMKITGHKTERSFLKYIRITEEETAQSLAKHPYFNQNLKVV